MSFVPADFVAPHEARLAGFCLTTLSPTHAQADYAAVRASATRIRHVFGPDNAWPPEDLSFEANLADLQRHEREFQARGAFAYSMWSLAGEDYLGCVYIKPFKSRREHDRRRGRFGAQVFFWLVQPGLDEDQVLRELQAWLARDWPWAEIAMPGRAPDWAAWAALA